MNNVATSKTLEHLPAQLKIDRETRILLLKQF